MLIALKGGDTDPLGAIVFDDGLVGVHHHALPVVADLGLPATIFAVTEREGARSQRVSSGRPIRARTRPCLSSTARTSETNCLALGADWKTRWGGG